MRDIAKPSNPQKGFHATAGRLLVAAALVLSCSGCMGMGDFDDADKKLTTNSVSSDFQAPPDSTSDEMTVRNAVSSADLSRVDAVAIPWANTTTGSAGVISSIREENNGSYVCRIFTTSRHSYRGISNFTGRACLVGSGEWQIVEFRENG